MSTLTLLFETIDSIEQNDTLLNPSETLQVLEAIKKVSKSKDIIDKALCLFSLIENSDQLKSLTKRESEIFNLIGCDFSTKEISKTLDISNATVSTHRKNIIKKLNIKGSRKLRSIAYQHLQEQLSIKRK